MFCRKTIFWSSVEDVGSNSLVDKSGGSDVVWLSVTLVISEQVSVDLSVTASVWLSKCCRESLAVWILDSWELKK